MSFKIPKELEHLEFSPIDNIDKIESGDLLVIPSEKDAPKLRVTLSTLRAWGLSVTSADSVNRYGCDRYSAARRAFGTPLTMVGATDRDAGSHIYVFHSATHDKNKSYGKEYESAITFENANSIADSRKIVEQPVFPLMQALAIPVDPLYPSKKTKGMCYPSTFSKQPDLLAYKLLTDLTGNGVFPTMSEFRDTMEQDGFPELPYFISVLSCFSSDRSGHFDRIVGIDKIKDICCPYGYGRKYDVPNAKSLVMTAPGKGDTDRKSHAADYFHSEDYEASKLGLNMSKKFIENVVKHGGLLFRSDKAHELCSRIAAHEVALEMVNRYKVLISKMENLVSGLSNELPTIKGILEKYEKASEKLRTPDEILNSVSKLF